jgi:hypothetical protein
MRLNKSQIEAGKKQTALLASAHRDRRRANARTKGARQRASDQQYQESAHLERETAQRAKMARNFLFG